MVEIAEMISTARPSGSFRRFVREPKAVVAGAFILFVICCAIVAPVVAPHDPLEQDLLLEKIPRSGNPGVTLAICSARTVWVGICCPG